MRPKAPFRKNTSKGLFSCRYNFLENVVLPYCDIETLQSLSLAYVLSPLSTRLRSRAVVVHPTKTIPNSVIVSRNMRMTRDKMTFVRTTELWFPMFHIFHTRNSARVCFPFVSKNCATIRFTFSMCTSESLCVQGRKAFPFGYFFLSFLRGA